MTDTNTVIDQFNEAFRLLAPDGLVDIIADDCVMEGVGPAPDGNRWTGYDECLAGWQGLIRDPGIRSKLSMSTWTATALSSAGGSTPPTRPSAA